MTKKSKFFPFKKCLVLILGIGFYFSANGQKDSLRNSVYKLNYKLEIPATLALYGTNFLGLAQLKDKPVLEPAEILSLDKNNVWFFDRISLNQSDKNRLGAHEASDMIMNVFLVSPSLLFLDKDIRREWLDVALLYLEMQSVNANFYVWAGPRFTHRKRPFVYHPDIALEDKLGRGTTDAFFSGHTSWTAGASFFMAKVYTDFHPELGNKKWLVYGAALIPPGIIGYLRFKALKHFPTDIMTGTAVGAAVGILVPHLHKVQKNKNPNLSILPYTGRQTGVALCYKF